MSFVLYGSSLRCRSVLNLRVSSSSMWTSLRDAESRADKEHRSCLGRKSFRCWAINWFREVIDLSISAACFCLWRPVPEWWHTDNVKKKKKVRLSLPPFLPLYKAIELCSFLSCRKKKENKKKKDRERIFQQRRRQIYARSGINLLACILSPPSRSESRSFHSGEGIYVRKATNDGSTWRFLLVARHVATFGLWRAVPRVRELPFLKGFSLWTDQSERVYFYWPPGPNPVVAISTRVGPGSRLMKNQIEWHHSRCHGDSIAHFKVVEARKRVLNENCHQDAILRNI